MFSATDFKRSPFLSFKKKKQIRIPNPGENSATVGVTGKNPEGDRYTLYRGGSM